MFGSAPAKVRSEGQTTVARRRGLIRIYETLRNAITPGLRSSQYKYRDTLKEHLTVIGRWPALGRGRNLFGTWMQKDEIELLQRHSGKPTLSRRISEPILMKSIMALAQHGGFKVVELKFVNSTAETFMLGPIVIFELLITRLLNLNIFRNYRSNILAVLRRHDGTNGQPT